MAFAHLAAAGLAHLAAEILPIPEPERSVLAHQVQHGLNAPMTSSMGRLFDAVSAILGLSYEATYEGEPAVALEMCAGDGASGAYCFGIDHSPDTHGGEVLVFDAAPVIAEVMDDLGRGTPASIISARFHNAVVGLVVEACKRLREKEGISDVALSGGCFQNVRLIEQTAQRLESEGFRPLIHRLVPPNDGGISLGQAVVAAARHQKCV